MLLRENFTAEYILRLRDRTKADPSILERTIFAFGLLEAISSVGMPFIFKGIKKISSIRNVNPLAYAYMIKSMILLNNYGLYRENIV